MRLRCKAAYNSFSEPLLKSLDVKPPDIFRISMVTDTSKQLLQIEWMPAHVVRLVKLEYTLL